MSNPVEKIYEYLRAKSAEESAAWRPPSETRFRPSEIGGCAREIYYRLAGNKPAPLKPESHILFKDGDLHHDAVRRLMLEAGVKLEDLVFTEEGVEETGSARRTIDVEYADKTYAVTLSGRTDGKSELDDKSVLLELKSVTNFKFDELQRTFAKGGNAAVIRLLRGEDMGKAKRQAKHKHRRFWYQFQTTLLVTQQPSLYVIFKERNVGTIGLLDADGVRHGVLVEADEEVQATILRRCASILRALERQTPPQAEFMDGSYSCSVCGFYNLCWGATKGGDSDADQSN